MSNAQRPGESEAKGGAADGDEVLFAPAEGIGAALGPGDEEELTFAPEDSSPDGTAAAAAPAVAAGAVVGVPPRTAARPGPSAWRLLVVDDDPDVHAVTKLSLRSVRYKDRQLEFLGAASAREARELLSRESGIAVILLDVVMETDSAGLDLARWIRTELGDRVARIILRTGQPGQAPEKRVIVDYDINDYKSKSELTAEKLFTSTLAALRGYEDLMTIAVLNGELRAANEQLEARVAARTRELEQANEQLQSLNRELDRLVVTDQLTGLANRRGVLASGEAELARVRRSGTQAALVTFDVDRFKRINDEHGHPAGDAVLARLGAELRNALRTQDKAGRIGGEEFLVVLVDTGHAGALVVAERLRRAFEEQRVETGGKVLQFTASFGITELRAGDKLQEAISRADAALYRAKNEGRNRVEGG